MTKVLIAIEEKGALGYIMRLVSTENWQPVDSYPLPVSDVARALRAVKILEQAAKDQEHVLVARGTVQDRVHAILELALAGTISANRAHALIVGEFFMGDNGAAVTADIYVTQEWINTLNPSDE